MKFSKMHLALMRWLVDKGYTEGFSIIRNYTEKEVLLLPDDDFIFLQCLHTNKNFNKIVWPMFIQNAVEGVNKSEKYWSITQEWDNVNIGDYDAKNYNEYRIGKVCSSGGVHPDISPLQAKVECLIWFKGFTENKEATEG